MTAQTAAQRKAAAPPNWLFPTYKGQPVPKPKPTRQKPATPAGPDALF